MNGSPKHVAVGRVHFVDQQARRADFKISAKNFKKSDSRSRSNNWNLPEAINLPTAVAVVPEFATREARNRVWKKNRYLLCPDAHLLVKESIFTRIAIVERPVGRGFQ